MRSFPININKKSVLSERIFFRKKGILEKRTGERMRIPKHIGIIPDGNRRWALSQQMEKKDGYQYGLEPGMKLLKKAKEYGVEELTYYGFTTDNCKRPKEQFDAFQSACVEAVEMLTQEGAVCAGCQVFFRCSRFMRILNRHWSGTTDRMLL